MSFSSTPVLQEARVPFNHRIFADGHARDTVVYSILDTEWPAARTGFEARLS